MPAGVGKLHTDGCIPSQFPTWLSIANESFFICLFDSDYASPLSATAQTGCSPSCMRMKKINKTFMTSAWEEGACPFYRKPAADHRKNPCRSQGPPGYEENGSEPPIFTHFNNFYCHFNPSDMGTWVTHPHFSITGASPTSFSFAFAHPEFTLQVATPLSDHANVSHQPGPSAGQFKLLLQRRSPHQIGTQSDP